MGDTQSRIAYVSNCLHYFFHCGICEFDFLVTGCDNGIRIIDDESKNLFCPTTKELQFAPNCHLRGLHCRQPKWF